VTDVRYCHRVASTLSTQRLATVPTVMLSKQSTTELHLGKHASHTIIDYLRFIQKLADLNYTTTAYQLLSKIHF